VKSKRYHTAGTVPTCDRNKQKIPQLEQFKHMIEINKKYHTVETVPTYDRNKQKIPHCWNISNI
jgi:hypothetical protein